GSLDFFVCCASVLCELQSFPTRRSSDLGVRRAGIGEPKRTSSIPCFGGAGAISGCIAPCSARFACPWSGRRISPNMARYTQRLRSEEHTSELQSHLNLVCRLLLEKKKTQ